MRTGGEAAADESLLASTCYLSRCHGNWGLGADCDQVEGKTQWPCPLGLLSAAGQIQASRWAVFCKPHGVALAGKTLGPIPQKVRRKD